METRPALVADIGGTNTRVALADGTVLRKDTIQRYRNADYPDLETVLRHYVQSNNAGPLSGACVAVAGPVRNGEGRMTNLNWTIDCAALTRATGAAQVDILNDLQAQGHALDHIDPKDLRQIADGSAEPNAPRLVIGIGTGFNVTAVFPTNAGAIATASESGHISLPVASPEDLDLAAFLKGEDGFAAVEDALSGRGLTHLYRFTTARAGAPQDVDSAEVMARVASQNDTPATEALHLFARILGTVASNLTLHFLPFGGLYLCGGMARAVAPHLATAGFGDAFRNKGRFSNFLAGFPISVIEDDYAALTGCAANLARGGKS